MYRAVNATIKVRAINEEDLHTYIALMGADAKGITFESFATNENTPFQDLLEANANPQHKTGGIKRAGKLVKKPRPDYSTPPGEYFERDHPTEAPKGRIVKKKTS